MSLSLLFFQQKILIGRSSPMPNSLTESFFASTPDISANAILSRRCSKESNFIHNATPQTTSAIGGHGCTTVFGMTHHNHKPSAKKKTKKSPSKATSKKKAAPKKAKAATPSNNAAPTNSAPVAAAPVEKTATVIYAGDVKNPKTKRRFLDWFKF